MSLLTICKYGDPILRQKCKPVEKITPDIRSLIRNMLETLYAAPGVGLAANQIGIPLQICVIDVKPNNEKRPLVLINPRIVLKSDKRVEDEGCLSLPGLSTEVSRFGRVRVDAVNDKGFPIFLEAEGLLSRVLQHEIDHLEGKLYIDYIAASKRRQLEQEIKKRKKEGSW